MKESLAKWIWIGAVPEGDDYAIFRIPFTWNGGELILKIAAETDYVAELNGKTVAFGAFAGFPDTKYYDTIVLTSHAREGDNELLLTVRYEGLNSATHIDDGAGVIFSVRENGREIAYSSAEIMGGQHTGYIQNVKHKITGQLGYSVNMRRGEEIEFAPSVETGREVTLLPRPVKKAEWQKPVAGIKVKNNLYDFGREITGYLRVTLKTQGDAMVKASYGEHIIDGGVRRLIGGRDFSVDFACGAGENHFENDLLRMGLRYVEFTSEQPFEVVEVSLLPTLYPLTERRNPYTGLDGKIYETAVRTLRLSMNYHYEDCPWREQALYVLDSRNQMLCGYHAFEETEFPRAMLQFMTKGKREDNLLELTFPAVNTPSIPFFSLMYPVVVWEYVKYTGDETILPAVWDTMEGIVNAFRTRMNEEGLIPNLEAPYWNFYEWTEGSDRGSEIGNPEPHPMETDLILNCAFVYMAKRYRELCRMVGKEFDYEEEKTRRAIRETFWHPDTGLFHLSTRNENGYSELGNAFALLIGLGDSRTSAAIKEGKLIPATLSMLGYVYDALLEEDEANADYVLADIRKKYGYMLEEGATSFWETINGAADFGDAGSLCHGWSAIPIHYFARLIN